MLNKEGENFMVERNDICINERHYNIMKTALKLACLELERSNIEITKDNIEILPYKMHNCLMEYYLMKAEKLVDKEQIKE